MNCHHLMKAILYASISDGVIILKTEFIAFAHCSGRDAKSRERLMAHLCPATVPMGALVALPQTIGMLSSRAISSHRQFHCTTLYRAEKYLIGKVLGNLNELETSRLRTCFFKYLHRVTG